MTNNKVEELKLTVMRKVKPTFQGIRGEYELRKRLWFYTVTELADLR